ncbi:hypothetical protein ABIF64_004414 [Bradyrhizobium japonicum]|nr:hypothetical protein [Bradyrhizobium japonicum]MCP1789901.1 hypothetical protein [Bradyrhizobium japonicum]MCP1802397.1 hypothetical protein [Bradyrhizobium japonicum]MCP1820708.1 hypothetical protein [Bradyrhizobium japonicum]MCP1867785.1 hypothetical protein [Bradyrhizobium japonicum]
MSALAVVLGCHPWQASVPTVTNRLNKPLIDALVSGTTGYSYGRQN